MDNIQKYKDSLEAFEKPHREALESNIKECLILLGNKETIPLNSVNCDGKGIMIGTYTDTINELHRDGSCVVYNNSDCEGISHHEGSYYDLPLDVTIEILICVRQYMADRLAKRQGEVIKIELERIARDFDEIQNKAEGFFGRDCKLFDDISDTRAKIEDIKEDISDDFETLIKKIR